MDISSEPKKTQRDYSSLVNRKFSNLSVIEQLPDTDKYNNAVYRCVCDCGNEVIANKPSLVNKHKQSCGCASPNNLLNKVFDRLTVVEKCDDGNGVVKWKCKCSCGNDKEVIVNTARLKNGAVKSCGCLRKETTASLKFKHGLVNTPEYNIWTFMIQRCNNPNVDSYDRYGGRGITVSDEWRNDFLKFLSDVGPRPSSEYSIDRKDNDGNYCKENCRWATRSEQNNNTSRNTFYELNGEILTAKQIAVEYGIPYRRIIENIEDTKRAGKVIKIEDIVKLKKIDKNCVYFYNDVKKLLTEWIEELKLNPLVLFPRLRSGLWKFKEAIQPIEKREITFSISGPVQDGDTQTLESWCELLRLDKLTTYLKVLRGTSFENIANECG